MKTILIVMFGVRPLRRGRDPMIRPAHLGAAVRSGLAAGLLLVLVACSGDDPSGPAPAPADPAPDFSLLDVNPTSATFDQAVSPRDHLQRVSAWYFGHAT